MISASIDIVNAGEYPAGSGVDLAPAPGHGNLWCTCAGASAGMQFVGGLSESGPSSTNWVFSPAGAASSSILLSELYGNPNKFEQLSDSGSAAQSGILFFGATDAAVFPTTSTFLFLVAFFDSSSQSQLPMNYFTPLYQGSWFFAPSSVGAGQALGVSVGVLDTPRIAWVQFTASAPVYLTVSTVRMEASTTNLWGLQGVALSSTSTPPDACFGQGTLVLCSSNRDRDDDGDGGVTTELKRIEDLSGIVQVVAIGPDGVSREVVPAYILKKVSVCKAVSVCTVAPGVVVTGDHSVALPGLHARPAWETVPEVEFGGPYQGKTWMAHTLPGWSPQPRLEPVYHVVPVDSPMHRLFGIVVGQEAKGEGEELPVLAEFFRSSLQEALDTYGFHLV